jgi:hypothetical protein
MGSLFMTNLYHFGNSSVRFSIDLAAAPIVSQGHLVATYPKQQTSMPARFVKQQKKLPQHFAQQAQSLAHSAKEDCGAFGFSASLEKRLKENNKATTAQTLLPILVP